MCVSQWSGGAVPAALFGPDCPQIFEMKLESGEQSAKPSSSKKQQSVCEFLVVIFVDLTFIKY